MVCISSETLFRRVAKFKVQIIIIPPDAVLLEISNELAMRTLIMISQPLINR